MTASPVASSSRSTTRPGTRSNSSSAAATIGRSAGCGDTGGRTPSEPASPRTAAPGARAGAPGPAASTMSGVCGSPLASSPDSPASVPTDASPGAPDSPTVSPGSPADDARGGGVTAAWPAASAVSGCAPSSAGTPSFSSRLIQSTERRYTVIAPSGALPTPATASHISARQSADSARWSRSARGGRRSALTSSCRMSSSRWVRFAMPRTPTVFAEPFNVCASRCAR